MIKQMFPGANRVLPLFIVGALLSACVSTVPRESCPADTQDLPGCPPLSAIDDARINELYESRTWLHERQQEIDPIEFGKQVDIPIQSARAKFFGPQPDDALNSLAAKIWMIENAEHTIDVMYYIFKYDLIGYSMLGALCEAVKRGVDIRMMVDSLGSNDMSHAGLKALETCAEEAGFMRNSAGEITTRKARVQVVIFNAISNVFINVNRRSHDKLLIVDGQFADKAMVITGGRNVSLSYYGIRADGSPNPDTYLDAELLLRPGVNSDTEKHDVGAVSTGYYTVLFYFKNNKRLRPVSGADADRIYLRERKKFREQLAALKRIPNLRPHYDSMPDYLNSEFHDADVRLAHELGNLTDKNVVRDAIENTKQNPNSITHVLNQALTQADSKLVRVVSPYLFVSEFTDSSGNVIYDGAAEALELLERHPDMIFEIVTNSVLTSDNFPAQAVIDMNMAPRLLLPEDVQLAWRGLSTKEESTDELVNSDEWQRLVNHPRLRIYETGRLDSAYFGGEVDYGKLHGKFVVVEDGGFVGTTNFDYRSKLYNNEMGFLFRSPGLADDINRDFDYLVTRSYRWGSPEWLEMRRKLRELSGTKASAARNQRAVYKVLDKTGLDKLF